MERQKSKVLEIKCCPFCGSSEIHTRDFEDGIQLYCADCLASGPVARIEKFAISLWLERDERSTRVEFIDKVIERAKEKKR